MFTVQQPPSLNKGGQGVAVVTGVSDEAVAEPTGVVAHSAAAALKAIEIGQLEFGDVGLVLVVCTHDSQSS